LNSLHYNLIGHEVTASIALRHEPVFGLVIRFASALIAFTISGPASGTPTAKDVGIVDCAPERIQDHGQIIIGDVDYLVCFEAYVSNFDTGKQRANETGVKAKPWGIPHWVLQRVEPSNGGAEGYKRPTKWFSIPDLEARHLAPTDDSYRFTENFRSTHPNWYERGHLAQKYLAERLNKPDQDSSTSPGWFTHNVANAVPQLGRFNRQPWLTLECYTGAWANRYHGIWILTGPVFRQGYPSQWLESDARSKAMALAIPDELFKIVARRDAPAGPWLTQAFIYPQEDQSYYGKGPWDPKKRLSSIGQIERLTGLSIFPDVPDDDPAKSGVPDSLWLANEDDFDKSCRSRAPKVHP
jgi:DNA/RNA endonuclease G (NUC1)